MPIQPNRTVIIVGTGPFISRSLALYLAKQNWKIGLISRSTSSLQTLASGIIQATTTTTSSSSSSSHPDIQSTTEVFTCTADAGDPTSLTNALNDLKQQLGGKLDVLVYNAAHVRPSDLLTLDQKTLEQDFKTSALGTLTAGQWFSANANANAFTTEERPLLLITGGVLDRNPNKDYASLSAAKAASQAIAVMFSKVLPEKFGILVGTPLIVEPIIPKSGGGGGVGAGGAGGAGGGYETKSDPDVIVQEIFRPYFEGRERFGNGRGGQEWVVERVF